MADCRGREDLSQIPWKDFTETEQDRLTLIDMRQTEFCDDLTSSRRGPILIRGIKIVCDDVDDADRTAQQDHDIDWTAPQETDANRNAPQDFDTYRNAAYVSDADRTAPRTTDTDDDHDSPPIILALTSVTLILVMCGFIGIVVYIHKVRTIFIVH